METKNRLKKESYGNLMIILLFVMVLVFLINVFVIMIKIYDFNEKLSGRVSGYVNLTLSSLVSIQIQRDVLNWSSGSINDGQKNATIYTLGDNTGVASRGNWSGENAKAFIVENIGNMNCSIRIQTGKNAHDFFDSSSSSNEEYKINVSNKETDSCTGALLGQWVDVNKSLGGTRFCNSFSFESGSNEIFLDVLLTVPYDGNIGEQSDTMTITAESV